MRRLERVSTISERMLERLDAKAVLRERRVFPPNWVDANAIKPMTEASPLRRELGILDAAVVGCMRETWAQAGFGDSDASGATLG